jgi:hypothetical protein
LSLVDEALVSAGAIWRFWQQRGHFAEARGIYDRLLALPGASPAARAKALIGAGGIAYWQNDFAVVKQWYREAVALYESVGDAAGTAEALFNAAYVPLLDGDLQASADIARRAIALFEQVGDEPGVAKSKQILAFVHFYDESLNQAAAIYRRHGNLFLLADTLGAQALPAANLADWVSAATYLREALALFEQVGNGTGIAMVSEIIAAGAGFVGLHPLSARLFGAAETLKEKLGGGAPSQLLRTAPFRAATLAALGESEFKRYYDEGSALSPTQTADLARSFEAPAGAPPLPYPEPWGVEAERRAAAVAAGTTPAPE